MEQMNVVKIWFPGMTLRLYFERVVFALSFV